MILRVREPHEIIDRLAIVKRLEQAVETLADPRDRRAVLLPVLSEALAQGRAVIQHRFLEQLSGGAAVYTENAYLTDQIVRLIFDYTTTWAYPRSSRTSGEHLAILAVGGYGRSEMSPFSDIDLLFLMPYRSTPLHEQVVEFALYTFWDMKLKVGHSTRSVDDCIRLAKQDQTIRTALLETRFVWGDGNLASDLDQRFQEQIVQGHAAEFIEAKLNERDERHKRMGDSRYVLEPNIKDGKGGLRDLQTLFWIARFVYGVTQITDLTRNGIVSQRAARTFIKARNFLWTVRCHLHYLTGRAEERLTFEVQPEIARRMNYADRGGATSVERFMRHYFLVAKDVGDLTRIFCAVLESQQKRAPRRSLTSLLGRRRSLGEFHLDFGRLAVADKDVFSRDPLTLMRIFKVAHEQGLDIAPETLRLMTESLPLVKVLRNDPKANEIFMSILTSRRDPEVTLRQMSESRVLGRFIPEFAGVTAQMQFDMYHVYTTDEHTIRAVGLLHKVESGALNDVMPLAVREMPNVQSRRALYAAVFLHDIAKGRGGDHSELGAEIAERLGPRLGLSDQETETAAWLIRQHLLMSKTAFTRDLENPKTIEDFVGVVQSMERLRLLLILTTVDILAVGPTVWNAWKASLLRDLFSHAEEVLSGAFQAQASSVRVAKAKEALSHALTDWSPEDRDSYLHSHYPPYWLNFDTLSHIRHARIIHRARENFEPVTVEVIPDPVRCVSEVIVHTQDQAGLFSKIAGALALSGANIVEARITTMVDGMALDVFTIQTLEGQALEGETRIKRLVATTIGVLSGVIDPAKGLATAAHRLPERALALPVSPRVLIDHNASKTHTVVEVNGRDRPGFLFAVTRTLADLGVQVFSARINTHGERAVDVFYIKDIFGMKIDHKTKLAEIHDRLLKVISDQPVHVVDGKSAQPDVITF